jgi:hypothetical protein
MRKEARMLLNRSMDSLVLAIERFNCPWDRGRQEVTLLLLDRAFELLLKAAILHKGGRIREPGEKETFGHDKCVRVCLSDKTARCLNGEQALTVQVINSLRDAAQHYMLDVSEQQLYMYAQAGLTLFSDLLQTVFGTSLRAHVPDRVLPVSTQPPKDLHEVVKAEFSDIKGLVAPGTRRHLQARAKIRSLAVIEASLNGIRSQPGDHELDKLLDRVRTGTAWHELFPGVASLQITTDATNAIGIAIRLTKKEGQPVHLVPEGTPGATIVSVKRVNELDYYSLGLKDLAAKLGLNQTRSLALVRHLALQSREDCFKSIAVGGVTFKRYSAKALDLAKEALKTVDMEKVWALNKPGGNSRRKVHMA